MIHWLDSPTRSPKLLVAPKSCKPLPLCGIYNFNSFTDYYPLLSVNDGEGEQDVGEGEEEHEDHHVDCEMLINARCMCMLGFCKRQFARERLTRNILS